jgi:superfamily II DNA or RNA helicase
VLFQAQPRIFMGNAVSQLANAPQGAVEALRYDLAYEAQDEAPTPTWDGWRRLMTPEGVFPSGLVPHVRRLLTKYGIEHALTDARPPPEDELPLHVVARTMEPRPYQRRLVDEALRQGRGVIVAPPRSGKTFMGELIFDANPVPAVWIAPTRGLVRQTAKSMRAKLPGIEIVELMGGKSGNAKIRERRAAYKAQIVVTTAATAVKLGRAFFATRGQLFIDEFHHAAAKTYQEINQLAENIYYRYGFTGTHERSDTNTEILMHAVLSNVIGEVSVEHLVANGWLAPARVFFIRITGPRVYATDPDGAYRFGIAKHEIRNAWVVWAARTLAAAGRRVLVLVRWVDEHGTQLAEAMPEATFVHGKTEVEPAIADFNAGRIPILIGSSVLGEGRDLPAASGLVYAKGGKASVTVKQDFYRVLTAHVSKDNGVIVDFVDEHNPNTMRHSEARSLLYSQFDDFEVEMLDGSQIEGFGARVSV